MVESIEHGAKSMEQRSEIGAESEDLKGLWFVYEFYAFLKSFQALWVFGGF